MRTQIYLTEHQRAELAAIADHRGKRQSEVIREAVDRFIEQASRSRREAVLRAAAGIVENAALKTLNVRHYPMLTGIEPAYRKQPGS